MSDLGLLKGCCSAVRPCSFQRECPGMLCAACLAARVIELEKATAEINRLRLENWQLKGALGYPIPGDIPEGDFKCGLCDARQRRDASPASGGEWLRWGLEEIVRCTEPRAGSGDMWIFRIAAEALLGAGIPADAAGIQKPTAAASPSPSVMEEDIIPAMRAAGFSSKEIRAVTYTSWKDGIDIDRPSTALVKFVAIIRGERR